mmetsp:Transcript_20652/g.30264  ORF Transcript_20652/g.30264 Transcript_20652/m.30264 type:complete len:118 (+) Transcript_20652:325-678(+)
MLILLSSLLLTLSLSLTQQCQGTSQIRIPDISCLKVYLLVDQLRLLFQGIDLLFQHLNLTLVSFRSLGSDSDVSNDHAIHLRISAPLTSSANPLPFKIIASVWLFHIGNLVVAFEVT